MHVLGVQNDAEYAQVISDMISAILAYNEIDQAAGFDCFDSRFPLRIRYKSHRKAHGKLSPSYLSYWTVPIHDSKNKSFSTASL
jgi:hypothetical protein